MLQFNQSINQSNNQTINQLTNPILIWVYPRKQGWPDLPHSKQQSLKLPLSISLDSWHPPSPNQHSCSPYPLASYTSSLVVLASSCRSLQTPTPEKKNMPIISPQHMLIPCHSIRLAVSFNTNISIGVNCVRAFLSIWSLYI